MFYRTRFHLFVQPFNRSSASRRVALQYEKLSFVCAACSSEQCLNTVSHSDAQMLNKFCIDLCCLFRHIIRSESRCRFITAAWTANLSSATPSLVRILRGMRVLNRETLDRFSLHRQSCTIPTSCSTPSPFSSQNQRFFFPLPYPPPRVPLQTGNPSAPRLGSWHHKVPHRDLGKVPRIHTPIQQLHQLSPVPWQNRQGPRIPYPMPARHIPPRTWVAVLRVEEQLIVRTVAHHNRTVRTARGRPDRIRARARHAVRVCPQFELRCREELEWRVGDAIVRGVWCGGVGPEAHFE